MYYVLRNVQQKFQMAKGKGNFKRTAQNFIFHFDTAFWQTEWVLLRDFLCSSPTPVTQHSPPVAAPLPLQMWKGSSYCPLTINSFFSFITILPKCHGDSHCFKSFRVPSPLTVATALPAPSLWSLWRLDLSQALDTATTYSSAAAKQDASPGDSLMELKTLNSPINLTASLNPTSLE